MTTINVHAGDDVLVAYTSAAEGDELLIEHGAIWPGAGTTFWLDKHGVNLIGVPDAQGVLPGSGAGLLRLKNANHVRIANFKRSGGFMLSDDWANYIEIDNIEFAGFSTDNVIYFVPPKGCTDWRISHIKIPPQTAKKKAIRLENASVVRLSDCQVDNRHNTPVALPNCLFLGGIHDVVVSRFHAANSFYLIGPYYQGDVYEIDAVCTNVLLEDCFGHGAGDAVIDSKTKPYEITLRRCTFGGAKNVVRLWYGGIIEEGLNVYDAHEVGDGQDVRGVWALDQTAMDNITGKHLVTFSDVAQPFGIG